MNAIAYAHDHQQQAVERLISHLSIPSVSTDPDHRDDMMRAAEWLADEMNAIGLENVAIEPTAGHPILYADWLHADGKPTVLIYGHYDVQPPDPLEEWQSGPFRPDVRDGKLYARGAADDKGQLFIHLRAMQALLETGGTLPVNVKLLLEGEEEIGSPHLEPWIEANRERLAADVAVISDNHILSEEQPTIVYGLRGLAYIEVHVESARGDMHSGMYGGAVHNPIVALAHMIAQLHDDNGTIQVPGFYDDVRPLTQEERDDMAHVPYTEATLIEETGALAAWGEAEYSVVERTTARPTLELNGIWGGFAGQGAKTVLPARAGAKISMRLVPDQDPWQIGKLVCAYLESIVPPTVRVRCVEMHHGQGAIVPRDIPAMRAASEAYEESFGVRPLFVREGGSIPVVAAFRTILGIHTVLMGFGLGDDNLHAPNEKLNLSMFYRGIETAILFYEKMAALDM